MGRTLVSKRILGRALGLALATTFVVAAQQAPPRGAPQGAPPQGPPNPQALVGKTAEQAFENIQVLKGVPADQIIPAMRVMQTSLGVNCQFCHVQGDFAKDDVNNKKTARMMITMMMDINKNNFGGRMQVTCITCHNGSNDPVNMITFPELNANAPAGVAAGGGAPAGAPQVPARGGQGAPGSAAGAPGAPPAAQGPTADQILASYVQAIGGEQALRKTTSLSITATRMGAPGGGGGGRGPGGPGGAPGGPGPGGPGAGPGAAPGGGRGGAPAGPAQVEMYMKAPNLSVTIVHTANGMTTASGFDGSNGWAQDARGGVATTIGTDQTRAARAADFYEPLDLKQEYGRLIARGTARVGDHDAYVVIGVPQNDQPERLFFDQTTGLLLRKIVVAPTPVGNLPTQTDYDDYRDIGNGVKIPYLTRVTNVPNQRVTTQIQNVQVNAPVDNGKFTKPAAAQ